MEIKKVIYLFVMGLFIILSGCAKDEEINIIHTDAMKANVFPEEKNGEIIGGMALLSSGINYFKDKNKGEFILVDAGSSLNGSVFSFYTQGKALVDILNNIGYDAIAIGNREFDYGIELVKELESFAKFSFLSANVYYKKNGIVFKEYIIKNTKQGTKIAIIGLSDEDMEKIVLKDYMVDYEMKNTEDVLDRMLEEIRKKADIVVVLSSMRVDRDRKLAEKYGKKIDLIISRTRDYEFDEKPLEINGVELVKSAGKSESAGCYTMVYNKKRGMISKKWENKRISSKELQPDKKIAEIIEKYSVKIEEVMLEKVGESVKGLRFEENKESEMGNFMADMLLDVTKADISFVNEGGIRNGLGKNITKGDIYKSFPFPSTVCTLYLKGEDIRKLLERSVTFKKGPLLLGGIKFSYDKRESENKRVKSINLKNGEKLDMEKEYKVASLNFLVFGGDNYIEFKNGRDIEYLYNTRALMTEYIKEKSPVNADIDDRMKEIN